MSNEFAEATLHKIATGHYTPEELTAFLQALEQLDETAFVQVYNKLYEIVAQQEPGAIDPHFRASLEEKLNQLPPHHAPLRRMHAQTPWIKWTAAAAVVLLIAGAAYWFTTKNTTARPVPAPVATKITTPVDAAPGGNHATLTLANGSVIVLDQAKEGDLAQQGGSRIVKPDSGQLVYYPATSRSAAIEYNTISTPRAGQFHIILPDGTHVWLNAASSLRFPTAFTGTTREVQLSGEGYFEVRPRLTSPPAGGGGKKIPFIVNVSLPTSREAGSGSRGNGERVEVLGTHFNINAYEDENDIKTTLLEGSVKVSSMVNGESSIIKPGEQTIVSSHSPLAIDHSPDVQKVIAWKNGFFEFNDMSLPAIMRQISRWYDVDVSLQASYPDKRFGGRISRKLNLANIVSMLETYGVHFKMENNKLIVVQ
jgi:ferric-dicitrate binding protein FerR (iron transport regulator)